MRQAESPFQLILTQKGIKTRTDFFSSKQSCEIDFYSVQETFDILILLPLLNLKLDNFRNCIFQGRMSRREICSKMLIFLVHSSLLVLYQQYEFCFGYQKLSLSNERSVCTRTNGTRCANHLKHSPPSELNNHKTNKSSIVNLLEQVHQQNADERLTEPTVPCISNLGPTQNC